MDKTQALNILDLLHDDIERLIQGREYDLKSHIASLDNIVKLQEFVQALPSNVVTHTYKISEHLIPALIYDDRTGLDDDDEAALDTFIADNTVLDGHEFINYDFEYDFPEFDTCKITNLGNMCVTIKLVFKEL